jgi:collagenase-like PrtC family protease
MDRVELLLPAGDTESLRAAVANGADAVYLGLDAFNARRSADNFDRHALASVVRFCHGKGVKVFVTANTLVKNAELRDFFGMIGGIGAAGADAVIVQDPCLVPYIRECAPGLKIHLSTQATTTNRYAVPAGVDRVIVPRELSLEQVAEMAKTVPVEMFVHGALCLSYSGQCLFSSMAGGRSGNRGRCAQPCRQRYNGAYPLSTRDLCLLEKLPEVIGTGVAALKVEGRMRGPVYTGAVARIYRKYLDMHYRGKEFDVDGRDIETLKMAFNRDFTTGFAFNDSVVDGRWPHNRGLYLGVLNGGRLKLEADLRVGDGVAAFTGQGKSGNTVRALKLGGRPVEKARRGDLVSVEVKGGRDGGSVFKTFSADLKVDLGDDFRPQAAELGVKPFRLPDFAEKLPAGGPSLHVKVHDVLGAAEAARAGASVVYYDIFRDDIESARSAATGAAKGPRFFLATPRVMSGREAEAAVELVGRFRPDGVLAGERGLHSLLGKARLQVELHLDSSFNVFNDIDLACWPGIPIISPELSLEELSRLRSKDFIAMVHGPLVLMTTREPLKEEALRDDSGRVFRLRRAGGLTQVLNCSELGLFNRTRDLVAIGVRRFYIEAERNVGKTVANYMKIISGGRFNDRNPRRGRTTGHLGRGVA